MTPVRSQFRLVLSQILLFSWLSSQSFAALSVCSELRVKLLQAEVPKEARFSVEILDRKKKADRFFEALLDKSLQKPDQIDVNLRQKYPQLTAGEVLAVRLYVGSVINEWNPDLKLWTGKIGSKWNSALWHKNSGEIFVFENMINLAQNGIKKLKATNSVTGYVSRMGQLPFGVKNPGQEFEMPGFTSCYGDGSQGRIRILSKAGVDVSDFSIYGHEAEVLFPPQTKFMLKDLPQNSRYKFELEEIVSN